MSQTAIEALRTFIEAHTNIDDDQIVTSGNCFSDLTHGDLRRALAKLTEDMNAANERVKRADRQNAKRLNAFCDASIRAYDAEERIKELEAIVSALHAKAGVSVEGLEKALDQSWISFCEANPDDLTSPEDLPDHALMTRAQFGTYALAALSTKLQEPVGETQATVYDWEFINPETGKWDYARTPEKAQKLIEAGIKVTPVYTIEQVTQTSTATLAHQSVAAGLERDIREECAAIGYRVCAETRHVTLGDKVRIAILAALKSEGRK